MHHYNDQMLDALERALSPERFSTYLEACNGDRRLAFKLYTWNTAASAAFYGPLQGLEIALRNAMHRELSSLYGDAWYDNPNCILDHLAKDQIDKAKIRLRQQRHPDPLPGQVVAELPFGFWVSLLGKGGKCNYEMTLWRPCLHKAFPNSRLSRKDAHRPLDYLRTFRNRIAHHEPIFGRHLIQDYQTILETTGWICMDTRNWIEDHSRVMEILQTDWETDKVSF